MKILPSLSPRRAGPRGRAAPVARDLRARVFRAPHAARAFAFVLASLVFPLATAPVRPADLIAQIYRQLGIAADARLPHPEGLDVRALPTGAGHALDALT